METINSFLTEKGYSVEWVPDVNNSGKLISLDDITYTFAYNIAVIDIDEESRELITTSTDAIIEQLQKSLSVSDRYNHLTLMYHSLPDGTIFLYYHPSEKTQGVQ